MENILNFIGIAVGGQRLNWSFGLPLSRHWRWLGTRFIKKDWFSDWSHWPGIGMPWYLAFCPWVKWARATVIAALACRRKIAECRKFSRIFIVALFCGATPKYLRS